MKNMVVISEIIGKDSAILHSDGMKVFNAIMQVYKGTDKLIISFEGLKNCTTSFLNAAVGKLLYESDSAEKVLNNLQFTSTDNNPILINKINLVLNNAKNPSLRRSSDEALRDRFHA